MKLYHICGLGAIAAIALTGCKGSNSASGNIAMVGKDPVTMKEYYDYLQRKPKFLASIQGRDVPIQVKTSPGYQAMQDLIVDKLILQLAREQNVFPTDDEVEKEFNANLKQNPHLVDTALSAGYTLDELKNDFRLELCRFKLATKGVVVTPQEVDDFIKNNPKQFLEPARVEASMVVVKDEKAKGQVDTALRSGMPFGTVAQQYSADKSASHQYPITDESKMPAQLRAIFDKTPELKATDWIPLTGKVGFIKFYIEKKIAATPMQVTDQVKETVKRVLMQQKGQKAGIDVNKEIADKIQSEKDGIKVTYKPNEAPWKEFTLQVGSALAASPTGTSASGAAANGTAAPAAGGAAPAPGASTPAPAGTKK